MSPRVKPDIVTFWHGGPLHHIHRMCLASQVKLGYRVTLYSYAPMQGLPAGVGNEDAAPVLPLSFLDRLPTVARGRGTNRPLLHLSDFFRIRLQRLGRGLWLDTDMYLLRPFEMDPEQPFFAWESTKFINNSVLYLPAAHPIVAEYERLIAADELLPDWLPPRLRARRLWWKLIGRAHGPQDLSTLVYGPMALTELAKRHHCLGAALSRDSFYKFTRTHDFFRRSNVAAILGNPDVIGIHVQRKARMDEAPVPGSMYEWALRNVAGLYA
jgi:hypothetical protein